MAAPRTPEDRAALAALGRAIRRLREQRGISQEAFGHEIDVHRTYVGGIERGERNPTFTILRKFANGLDIEPAALLSRAQRMREWPRENGD
jgi:transcriptional regulator with XRE-family HTH domain